MASSKGHVKMVKLLLRHRADFKTPDSNDDLPMHITCRRCQPQPTLIDCISGQSLRSLVITGIKHAQMDKIFSSGKWYYEVEFLKVLP